MILSPPRSVRVSTCGFFPSLFMLWNKLFSIRIRCPLKAQEDSLATWRVPGSSELAFPVSGVVFSVLTSHRNVYSSKKKMEGGTKARLEPASSRGAGTSRNFTSCSQQRSGGPCHMWRSGLEGLTRAEKTWWPSLNGSGDSEPQMGCRRKPKQHHKAS